MGNITFDQMAPKKSANLSINADLLQQAKQLNINLSQTLEQRLADAYAREHGLCLVRPLQVYGELLGVLAFHFGGRRTLLHGEFDMLRRFVDFAAVALANAQTRAELRNFAYSDPLTGLGNRRRLEGAVIGEDVLGEVERGRLRLVARLGLHRHPVLDPLQREREAAPLGVDFLIGFGPEEDHRVADILADTRTPPTDDIAAAIQAIRSHLIAAYGVDPYLIGDEVDWDDPPDPAVVNFRRTELTRQVMVEQGDGLIVVMKNRVDGWKP